jgi:hypothetical protein
VHGEEVGAESEIAELGRGEDAPVRAAGAIDAIVGANVVAGEVLAACGKVEAGLGVAVGASILRLIRRPDQTRIRLEEIL